MLRAVADRRYYLRNFHTLLDWIEQRYADVLGAPEGAFITTFRRLPEDSQALLTRMAMRKAAVFRGGKLRYPEIGPIDAAMRPLVEAGLADDDPPLDIGQLFALLNKPELLALFELSRSARQLGKAALLELLRPLHPDPRRIQDWRGPAPERVYRLLAADLCERLRLMFFGNFHQTWSEFVLADMGVFRFETVEITRQSRAFQDWRQVETFHHLYRCRERLHAGEPPAQEPAES